MEGRKGRRERGCSCGRVFLEGSLMSFSRAKASADVLPGRDFSIFDQ